MTVPDRHAHDLFGRARLPDGFTREDRVRLLRTAAAALLAGQAPPRDAALYIGGALDAWLRAGARTGSLERDHLRTTAPRGSHRTAAALAREEQHQADEGVPAAAERDFGQEDNST